MFARVSRYHEPETEGFEALVRASEEQIVPQVQSLPGFVGLQYLVDREAGEALSITYWETEEALRRSEEEANRIREEGNEISGAKTLSVERYEVVMRVGL